MKKAVVLLSSGLDSSANLALGKDAGFEVTLALTFDYGQKGAGKEILHAQRLCEYFGIEHHIFDFKNFSSLIGSKSALLSGKEEIPDLKRESLDDLKAATKTAVAVWVPNRNGVLMNIAAAVAESRGIDAIVVGFNAEEAVTFPDNTPEFMDALTESLSFSTANKVTVMSATDRLNKKEIVAKLEEKKFPFSMIWSCYRAEEKHCGQCESCNRLKRALETGIQSVEIRSKAIKEIFGENLL